MHWIASLDTGKLENIRLAPTKYETYYKGLYNDRVIGNNSKLQI